MSEGEANYHKRYCYEQKISETGI